MASPVPARARTSTPKRDAHLPPLLEAMLDAIPAFAVLVRDNGTIAYCNDPLARACGWRDDARRGRRLADLMPAESASRLLELADGTVQRAPLALSDGRLLAIAWSARPLTSEGGDHFVCVTGRDLTRETELEAFLVQNQWFETAAALAGGLAHDFNNVLAAILGLSEIISLRLPPGDPLQEFTGKIGGSVERAKTLVRRFSQFSRKHAGG